MSVLDPLRLERIGAFLRTHLILVALSFVFIGAEALAGVNPYSVVSMSIVVFVAGLIFACMQLVRRRLAVNWVIPGILSVDMIMVSGNVIMERGLESGWAATPILLIAMVPMFSHRRWLVWYLTALYLALYLGVFALRAAGVIDYVPRPVETWGTAAYTGIGFVLLACGVAVLAGRTSVDVLQSQQQLVDEIDKATKALREAQAQLIQQEKMASLGQLTAGVTHEINNPLTFVRTNLTSLKRDVTDLVEVLEKYEALEGALEKADPEALAEIRELKEDLCLEDPGEILGEILNDTVEGLDRVQFIIRDLKTFSRLEDTERRPLDLKEGLESSIKMLAAQARARGVEVDTDYREVPVVDAFPALLNQVFLNVLDNAVGAVPESEGKVRIMVDSQDGQAVVEIADNGPGVEEENVGKIFDPFFTTKEVGSGTGLGLALSYSIVERHEGRIEYEPSPEGGALFRVVLPLAA